MNKKKTLFTAAVVVMTACVMAGCGTRKPRLLQSSNGGGKAPARVRIWDADSNVDALKEWLNTIEINRQIAQRIATRVEGIGLGTSEIEGKSNYERALKNITPVLQSATFTGVVRKGDYWKKCATLITPKSRRTSSPIMFFTQ